MAKTTLHGEGESSAHALIRAGHYDTSSAWGFSAEDGDKLLGKDGKDWDKFGRWHLGEDPSEPRGTKAHWKFPYGKDGKVYRRALAAIRSRASQNGDTTIFDAAGRLMTAMDEEEGKKESSVHLRQILGSRFGHFAAPAPAPAAPPAMAAEDDGGDGGDDEARRAKKAEDDEAKRRTEEEEEARRARRGKGRRAKTRKPDDDDDDDEAGDDDEEDDDEGDMKKAATAGHRFALDAAFRAGARAQRRRCAEIFEHSAASANPVLAMSLAFETSMTAQAAIAVLEKTPAAPRANSLHDRMANSAAGGVRVPVAAPDGPRGAQAIAASWDAATKAVSGGR